MFVIESCQKIEYKMMIFIPVSNFGDQSLNKRFANLRPYAEKF